MSISRNKFTHEDFIEAVMAFAKTNVPQVDQCEDDDLRKDATSYADAVMAEHGVAPDGSIPRKAVRDALKRMLGTYEQQLGQRQLIPLREVRGILYELLRRNFPFIPGGRVRDSVACDITKGMAEAVSKASGDKTIGFLTGVQLVNLWGQVKGRMQSHIDEAQQRQIDAAETRPVGEPAIIVTVPVNPGSQGDVEKKVDQP